MWYEKHDQFMYKKCVVINGMMNRAKMEVYVETIAV